VFGEQKTKMLNFLSRAFAGHKEDKDWSIFLGNRNCGKGVLDVLMKNAVQGYTTTVSSGHFMYERFSNNDDVKKFSWMIDLQFVRLTTTQEINFDNNNKGLKVNGVAIKKLCSGGDDIEARKNFQDEIKFVVDTKLLIMCNDLPPIEPADALETCIEFKTGKQFVSKGFIEEKTNQLNELVKDGHSPNILLELQKYKEADDDIKSKCMTVEWSNAFIHLLMNYYVKNKIVIKPDTVEYGDSSLTSIILSNFEITKKYDDEQHFILYKDLKNHHISLAIKDSYKKFIAEMKELGCIEKKDGKGNRGLKGVCFIQKEVVSVQSGSGATV
jgi:hypothetical protein